MKNTAALNKFPEKHLKPYDGMSVTAEVWSQAHDEHRLAKKAHNLNLHGSGIINGLEVVANDPPDQFVFISPGAAVDSAGNVIVLTEPVAYDFGNSSEGTLFLLLGHGEREVGGVQKETKYLQYEFVIAARSSLPKRPAVELARLNISDSDKPVKNAVDQKHPGLEELDLRYRAKIGPETKHFVNVAVSHLGSENPKGISAWDLLSKECNRSTPYQLIIDQITPLSENISDYDLIFLAANGAFKLDDNTLKVLRKYLGMGKGLIIEAFDQAAQESCQTVFENLKLGLASLKENDRILSTPYLFGEPPQGASGNQIMLDQRVIYSTAGYTQAWHGTSDDKSMARSDIRAVHEWGVNMIAYCVALP